MAINYPTGSQPSMHRHVCVFKDCMYPCGFIIPHSSWLPIPPISERAWEFSRSLANCHMSVRERTRRATRLKSRLALLHTHTHTHTNRSTHFGPPSYGEYVYKSNDDTSSSHTIESRSNKQHLLLTLSPANSICTLQSHVARLMLLTSSNMTANNIGSSTVESSTSEMPRKPMTKASEHRRVSIFI